MYLALGANITSPWGEQGVSCAAFNAGLPDLDIQQIINNQTRSHHHVDRGNMAPARNLDSEVSRARTRHDSAAVCCRLTFNSAFIGQCPPGGESALAWLGGARHLSSPTLRKSREWFSVSHFAHSQRNNAVIVRQLPCCCLVKAKNQHHARNVP